MAVRRFQNCEDVRRFLAWLIRELEADRITGTKARDLGYLANTLLKSIEVDQFEKRIDALELLAIGKVA